MGDSPLLSRYFTVMNTVKKYTKILIVLAFLAVILYSLITFYPYIFAKTVVGKIEKVERVQVNVALMQNNQGTNEKMDPQLFSFAVAIKDDTGAVHTASAEDRQWAAVSEGLCVTAKFFPYAPWNLEKAGTFYGARLLESHVCN